MLCCATEMAGGMYDAAGCCCMLVTQGGCMLMRSCGYACWGEEKQRNAPGEMNAGALTRRKESKKRIL